MIIFRSLCSTRDVLLDAHLHTVRTQQNNYEFKLCAINWQHNASKLRTGLFKR